jgi:nucleoside-diphosphate-sugar epimerase
MSRILVCGGGGFIGTHLVNSLKSQGNYVVAVDLHKPLYSETTADKFYVEDLRNPLVVDNIMQDDFDEVYQLAADMGGAGYIFTGEHDADIMHNSAMINLNVLDSMRKYGVKKVLYTSSACVYPERNQLDPDNPNCEETSAYPAAPDSEYGWEKLFSERLYMSYRRNYGIECRIVRFHNVFGPLGSWNNGKEKAPAALCRKVLMSNEIEVWGDGNQTRSFLYIKDAIEGLHRVMDSDFPYPINLGSDRMISINNLVLLIAKLVNKEVTIKHIVGPRGVMGRNSDNTLIKQQIGWAPPDSLEQGLIGTCQWIQTQIK